MCCNKIIVPKKVKICVAWIVVGIIVLFIYGLTLQTIEQTSDLTNATRQIVISTAKKSGIEREVTITKWWANTDVLRKLAHIVEYFLLGLAVNSASNLSFRKSPIIKTQVICFVVSFTDQIMKRFVPRREFDGLDLILDVIGYTSATFVLWLVRRCFIIRKERMR